MIGKTYCPFHSNCSLARDCNHPPYTPEVHTSGDMVPVFVAPPVCHSHWKDRQDLSDE